MRSFLIKTILTFSVVLGSVFALAQLYSINLARASQRSQEQIIEAFTLSDKVSESYLKPEWTGVQAVLLNGVVQYYIFSPQKLVLSAGTISGDSGVVILEKPGIYRVNSVELVLNEGVLLFDMQKTSALQLSGSSAVGATTLQQGEEYDYATEKQSYERQLLNTQYSVVIQDVSKWIALPDFATDFTAPQLTFEAPLGEQSQSRLTLQGWADDAVSVEVGGKKAAIENKVWKIEIDLVEGKNSFEIIGSDELQNTSRIQAEVTYVKPVPVVVYTPPTISTPLLPTPSQPTNNQPAPTPPQPASTTARNDSTIACENSGFNSQFISLLNTYRLQNGLNTLAMEDSLNLAACDHAKWMSEGAAGGDYGARFSHTGYLGSTAVQRCTNRNSYCDAENLAVSVPDNTPQKMFDLYRNSPGHNANMLGNHSVVGLAWAGYYQVNVFR